MQPSAQRVTGSVYGLDVDDGLPTDSQLVESVPVRQPGFDEGPGSVLTPMGQVNSAGAFARGLGARRLRIAIGIGGASLLFLAILSLLR